MLVAAVIQTCRLELLQVPREIYPRPSYTSLKEALHVHSVVEYYTSMIHGLNLFMCMVWFLLCHLPGLSLIL
jgi:hypothetical protein